MCDTAGTRDRTPTVFRRGTVVTMNDAREVLPDADLRPQVDHRADRARTPLHPGWTTRAHRPPGH